MSITFDEFMEDYNFAPYSIEDFAIGATRVEDNPELQRAAAAYLQAQGAFFDALDDAGVEIG